jgi:hypothetical protein
VRLTFVMVGDMIKPVRIVHEGRRDAAETEAVREQVKAEVKVKRLSGPHVDLSLSLIAESPPPGERIGRCSRCSWKILA